MKNFEQVMSLFKNRTPEGHQQQFSTTRFPFALYSDHSPRGSVSIRYAVQRNRVIEVSA